MKFSGFTFLIFFTGFGLTLFAQRTETAINFSEKKSRFIFDLDNDMLFSTDSYYTAGVGMSYTHSGLKKTPTQLILSSKNTDNLTFTGFGIEQRIFTPSSITAPDSITNDQPYSAYLLATNFSVLINQEAHLKISNELGIGVMGPAAGGEEMQTLVHEVVNSPIPVGWDNQLQNTFLIDYHFRIEKGFFNDWTANHIIPFAAARIGTLTNRVQIGMMVKLGNKNQYLVPSLIGHDKLIWEWVFSANLQGVFYDATLQGSMFKEDPNALDKSEIVSHQYQFRTGFNLYYRNFSLRYMLNFNSSNLNSTVYHRYGGVNIGYSF